MPGQGPDAKVRAKLGSWPEGTDAKQSVESSIKTVPNALTKRANDWASQDSTSSLGYVSLMHPATVSQIISKFLQLAGKRSLVRTAQSIALQGPFFLC